MFLVDLESKYPGATNGREYLDIGCSFAGQAASCAIELKFKTEKQSAQNHGRVDVYQDLEALERACQGGYSFGRFFMITDSSVYVHQSGRGLGTVFATHDGHQTVAGSAFHYPKCAGRPNIRPTLKNSYAFQWENIGPWYFLELNVPQQNHTIKSQ